MSMENPMPFGGSAPSSDEADAQTFNQRLLSRLVLSPRLAHLARDIREVARCKGFSSPTREDFGTRAGTDLILSKLMLVCSEAAEACEAARKNDPDNFAEELADIVIRVLDLGESMGFDLEAVVLQKVVANSQRPHMHGGKLA